MRRPAPPFAALLILPWLTGCLPWPGDDQPFGGRTPRPETLVADAGTPPTAAVPLAVGRSTRADVRRVLDDPETAQPTFGVYEKAVRAEGRQWAFRYDIITLNFFTLVGTFNIHAPRWLIVEFDDRDVLRRRWVVAGEPLPAEVPGPGK